VKKDPFFQRGWHLTIVSAICLGVFLVPIFWMISTALKPLSEINAYPPRMLPEDIDWSIWSRILSDPQILRFFLNSLIVASGTTVLTLVLAVPCAYGIAHLPIRGKSIILLLSLSSLMFPSVMIAIPLFVIFNGLGLVNTYPGLIFADSAICLPFAITILRPFFRSIPRELSEAARIDGCGLINAFRLIILPLSTPAVLTVGIFTFLAAWGDLLMALSLNTDEAMRPVTSGLFKYMGNNVSQWNMVMAFATLEMLPPLVLFLAAQKYVVAGLTDGAVKG
jgi:multiple sugar transport system permease protein